jgi:hypothetical protein
MRIAVQLGAISKIPALVRSHHMGFPVEMPKTAGLAVFLGWPFFFTAIFRIGSPARDSA